MDVLERHALGPPGRAAGVQDQGDVIGCGRRRTGVPARTRNAHFAERIAFSGQDRNVSLDCGAAGGVGLLCGAFGRQHQQV